MQTSSQATRFRFADLTLDVGQRCVARDGQALHFGKLTYEMLVTLVEAAPNVVTHDRLAERVWRGRAATPETVTQRVKLLRLALDDDPSRPRYVEVVRGQGYRLIPPVERESETAAPAVSEPVFGQTSAGPGAAVSPSIREGASSDAWPSRRPRPWLATGALLVAAGIGALVWYVRDQEVAGPPPASRPSARATVKSIAVLPFADMSERQNQRYIADGIAEEILDRLAQNEGLLRVIARTSSFSFRDRPAQIPEIAAKLNVSHILEGSVRRSGDRIRITVQLVEGAGATHVWSETYDRELGDLFVVQDEIAASVAEALQVALAGGAPQERAPASVEAYQRFLHGEFFYNRRAPGDIERSVKYYENAVSIDPGYARAWAALSGAYSLLVWDEGRPVKALQLKQGEAARRAVALDPRLAVAHVRLARFYYETRDFRRGDEHSQKAVALDPDDPLVLGSTAGRAISRGDIGEAIALQRRVVSQDPLAPILRSNLAHFLLAGGQLDEALSEFRRALELNPDAGSGVEVQIPRILILQQRYEAAQAAIAELPEGKFRDHGLALLYQVPGRRAEADTALERLAAQPGDIMDSIGLAEVYAFRGMNEEAFASLQRKKDALERNKTAGPPSVWHFQTEMRVSPFLKPLHADPRWAALLAATD